jgi:hypothetical protein
MPKSTRKDEVNSKEQNSENSMNIPIAMKPSSTYDLEH